MTESLRDKLFLAAKKVGDLNKYGEVKGFSGNENGYAKIKQIRPGCAIWIHHLKDETLIIDLLITETAISRYPNESESTLKKFEAFAGEELKTDVFEHSVDISHQSGKFYLDVTNQPFEQISETIDKILKLF
ncbi:hypothetical protein [Desulfatitalea alkaliphila]|uniref:Uncharacterized protein n=1 Tax=Desulfatitalea alkaliphila TaxID=2929485 RepID=A0AA41R5K3_9BACT|nr:hypothetical protein [Desulfatitalea alkaliphila]MCJ8503194.1 hypothetical protein [Desulfatitalea alkaliphila]